MTVNSNYFAHRPPLHYEFIKSQGGVFLIHLLIPRPINQGLSCLIGQVIAAMGTGFAMGNDTSCLGCCFRSQFLTHQLPLHLRVTMHPCHPSTRSLGDCVNADKWAGSSRITSSSTSRAVQSSIPMVALCGSWNI